MNNKLMDEKVFSTRDARETWDQYFTQNKGLIIDLGCGYGADAYYLAQRGYQTIAVDENNNLKFSHPGLKFREQKIEKLINKKFDGVIACFSLHFLEPETRLKTVAHYLKCLKKGGIFYILIFDKFLTPAFLKLFSTKPQVEYFTISDNHPPDGKHTHRVARVVYRKI